MRVQNDALENGSAARPAHRTERPDPTNLPIRFVSQDPSVEGGERAVTLDSRQVVMARRLGPMAMNITLPLTSYRGVAIRLVPVTGKDEDRVAIVLTHKDRAFDIQLFEAETDEDVIAEWQLWGTTLGLPLLVEGLDGHIVAAETRLGEVEIDRPRPRRRHSLLAARRPRFLARRRVTRLPVMPFVYRGEREIFAPE